MRWDRLTAAAAVALFFTVIAVVVLMVLGMSFVDALATGGLCWLFGTVAALSGTAPRRGRGW